jgi:hypothetical protein
VKLGNQLFLDGYEFEKNSALEKHPEPGYSNVCVVESLMQGFRVRAEFHEAPFVSLRI